MFVSGSYDERVRVWDNRNLSRPICTHIGAPVGGGVWRLKWHPHTPGVLLGACMHGGARIFSVCQYCPIVKIEVATEKDGIADRLQQKEILENPCS